MHEMALMQNLLTTIEKTIKEHPVKRINSVTLSVGELSNAMPDALSFAFETASQNGTLKGAKLIINKIPVMARCETCGEEYKPAGFPFICPVCKSNRYTITQGEDIYIDRLDCET